jgi:hypothetical protein
VKKNHNGFVGLLIFLALIAMLTFVYMVGTFSHFNSFVDSIISGVAGLFGKQIEQDVITEDEAENFDELIIVDTEDYPEIDISQKNPVFCGKYIGNTDTFSIKRPNATLFKVTGFDVKTKHFSYSSGWKYISEPVMFSKYLAIFTGEPELQIFDITSNLIYSCAVPVYPDKIVHFDSDIIIFNGRDGNTYYFEWNGKTAINKEDASTRKSPKEMFNPDSKCSAAIKSRLDMWTDKKIDKLPSVSFFPTGNESGTTTLYDSSTGLSIYAFSPLEQGKYKIGFAEENGTWSDCRAFVFVFLQDGEMLSMSFEYYADKPQVEVSLSDNELYYIVCGNMDGVEIPENTVIAVKGM